MLPFPAEIAGFPDVSRLIPVYPAFLKYIVPVQLVIILITNQTIVTLYCVKVVVPILVTSTYP